MASRKDPFAGLAATTKTGGKKAAEEVEIVISDTEMRGHVTTMCGLTININELKSPMEKSKKEILAHCFDRWLDYFWTEKKFPGSPHVVAQKTEKADDEEATPEAAFTFQVKFQVKAVNDHFKDFVADKDNTLESELVKKLIDIVGPLSQERQSHRSKRS
jgi:hypothetical protein